jgi:NAD(P)-dependent dehydrogenase (short-subunit alcohol dehydrogenase family)
VRVNVLVLAGVFNHQDAGFMKAYLEKMPLGRMADPEDYVGPVLFLASSASAYMTGSTVTVDGGWTAW